MPVVFGELLEPMALVAGFFVCWGIVYVLHNFTRAVVGGIAGLIGSLPGIRSILSGPINAVYHWMDHEFGAAEAFLEARMTAALHQLARVIEWVGKEFRTHGALLLALAQLAANPFSIPAWRTYLGHLQRSTHGALLAIQHATVGFIGAAVHTLVRPIWGELHAVERWTYPKIKTLEREVTHDIPQDIAGLRTRAKTIEGELSKAWDAIRKNEAALAATAMVGVVALALQALGGSWIRCRNWNRIGRHVCSTPFGEIEGVLGLLATGAVIADFRELVKLAQTVEHGVAVTLQDVAKL